MYTCILDRFAWICGVPYHFPNVPSVAPGHQSLQHYPQRANVVHPSPGYGSTTFHLLPTTSSVTIAHRMHSPTPNHPKFPSPMHNQFIVYLLQYCPQKTPVCFGCGNTLKPGGFIGNPPMDLVIVSCMARSWVQDNQVFSKHANVYFHCQPQCVQKNQLFIQQNFGIIWTNLNRQ